MKIKHYFLKLLTNSKKITEIEVIFVVYYKLFNSIIEFGSIGEYIRANPSQQNESVCQIDITDVNINSS